jgi:hypothetical protein
MGRHKEEKPWYKKAVSLSEKGKSQAAIGRMFKVTRERVRQVLVEYGGHVSKDVDGIRDKIIGKYNRGRSIEDISGEMGMTLTAVRVILERAGVSVEPLRKREWYGEAVRLSKEELSLTEIAKRINKELGTVSTFLRKNLSKSRFERLLDIGRRVR